MKSKWLIFSPLLLAACSQGVPQATTKPVNQTALLASAQQIVQKNHATPGSKVYVIDLGTHQAYEVKWSAHPERTLETQGAPAIEAVLPTTDLQYEPQTAPLTPQDIQTQSLATCPAADGPYYMNRVLGTSAHAFDTYLPSDTQIAQAGAGAFMYSGFQSKDRGAIYEVGWQWTQQNPRWALYLRVFGDVGSGYAPGTGGLWKNGWKMNSATYARDVPVHVNSMVFYGSDGLQYVTSQVSTSTSSYVVGIRSDNPNIGFYSLRPENESNIYSRKLVSMAKNTTGDWDNDSHINNGKYRNSTFTRQGVVTTWTNFGCTFGKDGIQVFFDPNSPYNGDTASLHK